MYKIDKDLDAKQITDFISAFESNDFPKLNDKYLYFLGRNPYIGDRVLVDGTDAPNWKCPVSYGRKIINTVSGYMFKPGLIKYEYIKESYAKSIDEIFKFNKEQVKTAQIGKIVSNFGFGYELFYTSEETGDPVWCNVDVRQIVPIYNYDIDPKLYCFIRFWNIEEIRYIDVYYSNRIEHYKQTKKAGDLDRAEEDTINIYNEPPLNIIKNNDELIGDYEPAISLIDAYDVLISDSMNEFDRFAWAYLIMTQKIEKEDLEKIKRLRVFQGLDNKDAVSFLTKQIPSDYIKFMQEWIKREIHEQTHVPDFLEMSGMGQTSGVAMDRLLYDFEFICATKEAYFKEGLYNRFKLIDKVVNVTESQFVVDDIKITMNRNKPSDNLQNSQIFNAYYGKLSAKPLISNFAPFIEDVDDELAAQEEEAAARTEMFNESMFLTEEQNTSTEEK